jgi:hypothetical protein
LGPAFPAAFRLVGSCYLVCDYFVALDPGVDSVDDVGNILDMVEDIVEDMVDIGRLSSCKMTTNDRTSDEDLTEAVNIVAARHKQPKGGGK